MNTPGQEELDLDITPTPGTPARVLRPRTVKAVPGRAVTNDLDLIEDVIRLATAPGYVLAGPSERVWRNRPGDGQGIERVPDYEDAAVHQLLSAGWLTRAHAVTARYSQYEGRAVTVTVPPSTRQTALRWRAYTPHPGTGGHT